MSNITSADIRKICVIGAGTMGSGIAAQCANAGFDVLYPGGQEQPMVNPGRLDQEVEVFLISIGFIFTMAQMPSWP